MGLVQRVEQIRRVVVLRPDITQPRQLRRQHGDLIHVVTAGGVPVHLLQQVQVGILLLQKRPDALDIGGKPLLRPRTGLRTAVHEEAVIVLISAEANIIGEDAVLLPRLHGGSGVPLHRQLLIPDAVIVDEHIGHIPQHHHQQRQHHSQHDLPSFSQQCFPLGLQIWINLL